MTVKQKQTKQYNKINGSNLKTFLSSNEAGCIGCCYILLFVVM